MSKLFVVLTSMALSCCPVVRTTNIETRSVPVARTSDGPSLMLKVVDDPNARGLDSPKALQLTLENGISSNDVVLINGRMAVDGRTAIGEVHLDIRSERGQVANTCLANLHSAEPLDYIMLGPGDSITRLLSLSCFHLGPGRIVATATYEDKQPPPEKVDSAFRGKLISNTVVFSLHDSTGKE